MTKQASNTSVTLDSKEYETWDMFYITNINIWRIKNVSSNWKIMECFYKTTAAL